MTFSVDILRLDAILFQFEHYITFIFLCEKPLGEDDEILFLAFDIFSFPLADYFDKLWISSYILRVMGFSSRTREIR